MLRDNYGDGLKATILILFTMVCTGGFFWLYRFYEIDALRPRLLLGILLGRARRSWKEGDLGAGIGLHTGYHDRLLPEGQ